jgi:hypothetical protein
MEILQKNTKNLPNKTHKFGVLWDLDTNPFIPYCPKSLNELVFHPYENTSYDCAFCAGCQESHFLQNINIEGRYINPDNKSYLSIKDARSLLAISIEKSKTTKN